VPANPIDETRLLISGLGCITRPGIGADDLLEAATEMRVIRGGRRSDAPVEPMLLLDFDLAELVTDPPDGLDLRARCALGAAALAWENAAIQYDEVEPPRCGLCMAGGRSGRRSEAEPDSDRLARLLAGLFRLEGPVADVAGGALSGAVVLERAVSELGEEAADLMLAVGADAAAPAELYRMAAQTRSGAAPPAQGAAALVVETDDRLERREGYAFCELASVRCCPLDGAATTKGVAGALDRAVQEALDAAGIWEGDVGLVQTCSYGGADEPAGRAQEQVLRPFSKVPTSSLKELVGETFGAGFLLECMAAAQVLSRGSGPPNVTLEDMRGGVEFWLERQPEPLMGHSALVLGAAPGMAAAAVLRSV